VPLLPQTKSDQTKLAVSLIAVALAAYYYMYPYSARAGELETTRARVEELETANAKVAAEAQKLDARRLAEQTKAYAASLAAMKQLVPAENEVPMLLEQVSTAARRAGLDISGVSPEPVQAGEQFDTYRYKLSVVGGYHALATFLSNVGSLPRIVAPVTFTLGKTQSAAGKAWETASKGKKGAALEALVTIQTYVVRHPAATSSSARRHSAGETLP
jgi:type IV pilus assembly protein PilO